MKETNKIFKALADKNRVRILKMLEKRALCVCEITSVLGLATSTTSKHLSVLKEAQLIFEQKEGKWVNYHLNRVSQNRNVKEMLSVIDNWLNDDKMIQTDISKMDQVDRLDLCKG